MARLVKLSLKRLTEADPEYVEFLEKLSQAKIESDQLK